MYLVKTPRIIDVLYNDRQWRKPPTVQPSLYLTFDDGPIPELTPAILDILQDYDVKATFFCVGDNVRKHPHIYQRVLEDGNAVGNHTMHHMNSRDSRLTEYINEIINCSEFVESRLFRPPYGRLSRKYAKAVKDEGYTIIMWDILSGDFDPTVSPEKCLDNVVRHIENGSIIVMHDNIKSSESVLGALPHILDFSLDAGYQFQTL